MKFQDWHRAGKGKLISMLIAALVLGVAATSHAADALAVVELFGHNEANNTSYGLIADMINGSGMNGYDQAGTNTWPVGEGDPSTWTRTLGGYQQEWQSMDLLGAATPAEDFDASGILLADGVGPSSNKVGWTVFDFGALMKFEKLYIWHVTENSARIAALYNVLVSESPTADVPHGPTSSASRDYDFSSGGWTTVSASLVGTQSGTEVVDLTGYKGRYIALEIISNGGDANRAGFAEIGVTGIVAPPSGTVLIVR